MTNTNKKSSMYVIERGVPLPSNRRKGKWVTIASQMKNGDSIVVATFTEQSSLRQAIIRGGSSSSVFELPDGSFRVWKLPKKQ